MNIQTLPAQAAASPAELAQILKVSPSTVARRLADGTIRSVKIGRLRRIPPTEVERLLQPQASAA
ncbi:MAG: helix-turn-helix domain-containing protein [Acetobacteraceae bacterium]